MIEAIIAGCIAVVVTAAIIALIFIVRHRRSPQVVKKPLKQVDTFGIGSSPIDPSRNVHKADDVRVVESKGSIKKPSEGLRGRFAALGVLGAAVFGSLTAKLWSLQLLSNQAYSEEADENLYTTVSTPAPRGVIYDRNGIKLVANRASQTVLAEASVADSRDVVRLLSTVLGIPAAVIRGRIKDTTGGAQSLRIVAEDVRLRDVAFIAEHAEAFPGVSIETRTVRSYPYKALGAHVLGYTGAPTEDQLKNPKSGREVMALDTVGLSGIEAYYDSLISGDHGSRRVKVDSRGNVIEVVSETRPAKGSDLYLTIDARVQYAADQALASLIAPGGTIGQGKGVAGAAVVLDVRDGSVIALSSYPTFDPSYFTGGIPTEIWERYNTESSHAPLNNRAVDGQYAAASTFKTFTSMASLHYGFASKESSWDCSGSWDGFNSGHVQHCWSLSGHGTLDLRGGIVNSCDTVFYELGKAFFDHGPSGTKEISETALQDYLATFNFDKPTGIDLEHESTGRIPTPAWKKEYFKNRPADGQWVGGDYSNMMIGQGDVLVTPLSLAVAYGGITTGAILKPHLMKEVKNSSGETVVSFERTVVSEPEMNADDLAYVRDALLGVINENGSNARNFGKINVAVAGKSGTAEHAERNSDAWFVAYGPYEDPKYVAVAIVEQGGGGSDVAGPLVATLLKAALDADEGASLPVEPLDGSSGESVALTVGSTGRTD